MEIDISKASEELKSIADPKEKANIKAKRKKDFNERSKDVPLDKKVTSMWAAYQTLTPVKPTKQDLMSGFGEMGVEAEEIPPIATAELVEEPVEEQVEGEDSLGRRN